MSKSPDHLKAAALVPVAAIVLTATLAVPARSAESKDTEASVTNATSTPAKATSTAPVTKQPAPSPDTPAAPSVLDGTDLGRMLRRDFSALKIEERPDGATKLDVRGGFRSVLVMHTGAAGEPILSCILSAKEAEQILEPQPAHRPDDRKEP